MQLLELIQPNIEQKIEALYLKYQRLNHSQQLVLQILAVIYKPTGMSKLNEITSRLVDLAFLPNSKKSYRISLQHKQALIDSGLLTATKGGLHVCKLLANRLVTDIASLPCLAKFSQQQKWHVIMLATDQVVPVANSLGPQEKHNHKQAIIRGLYYLDQLDKVETALAFDPNPQIIDLHANTVLIELLFLPFDLKSYLRLPMSLQYQGFATLFKAFQKQGINCEFLITLLEQVCGAYRSHQQGTANNDCYRLLAEQYLIQMRFSDFEQTHFIKDASCYGLQLRGTYAFLTGKNKQAIGLFEKAIVAKNRIKRRKKPYLAGFYGYFYKLALIVEGNQSNSSYFATALQQLEHEQKDLGSYLESTLSSDNLGTVINSLSSGQRFRVNLNHSSVNRETASLHSQFECFNYVLGNVWCNYTHEPALMGLASSCQAGFKQLGFPLFSRLSHQLCSKLSKLPPVDDPKLFDISSLIKFKAQWDLALDKLIALSPRKDKNGPSNSATESKTIRLIWELSVDCGHKLTAREQKLTKSGWSKGRVISLEQLKQDTHLLTYLSVTDKHICRSIESYQNWSSYHSKIEHELQGLKALEAAVGIDNLYLASDLTNPIELCKREPELLVNQQGDQLCLSIADISAEIDSHSDFSQETSPVYNLKALKPRVYQLTVFLPEHIKVAEIIGESGLLVPVSAKQKALEGIAAIAPLLNIQSDISELETGLESFDCDKNLAINIEPTQNGLSFTCVVMPFGDLGPALIPGVGNASITHELKGKRCATQRDLLYEETLLDQLDKLCPAFLGMSGNTLILDDLQIALGVLEQLESVISQDTFDLILRWPKGKKVTLTKTLDSTHLTLSFSKKSEWFNMGGDLQVDNSEVIEFKKLLALVASSNGRFIALADDQILALTSDLRNKLDQINHLTEAGKFHPLASLQIEQATRGMRMKTIHAWDDQTVKMHQANALTPVLPSTFKAQLRDYQLAGFDWATRLAHWGAGACLADDMGLGKTLQALAVLLFRAEQGPSLIIAPTSVCLNWQQEALRFTPTLNLIMFADATSTIKRTELLASLQPFDCVVISYGLLQREGEILKNRHWHTIVADEAQALKNPLAKRTKAAYALKADFKMITTGTPIENDLSELWSLFRFINPGLLGGLKRFGQRFALPIENAKQDRIAAHKARQGLRTLVQPFILRRMKNQVLTELPPRTNINIRVEMSEKEHAFYQALRLNALDNISQSALLTNAGEQRIKMLAELVKLRQACCHSKLVLTESTIPSAKLGALDELLEELKQNNHKALIFSQFVGHLQLIKQHVEEKGFSYQYLDGSTPQKQRQQRVNAFQRGDTELFLISLKAGGSGLNLTAADYVIHMDPWWNPAVEEQASDRAHRMGQTRPVTIYRLITQNTIEEKIVALHQHKRDLADQLLADTETVTKLSVDDMLSLLKETF